MSELRDQLQATLGDSLVLEQELGGGGMSRVFVAQEPALGRRVVVKVLPPEMAAAVSIDRFRREIQLAAQLQHPHIVPLLSAGETNGLPYFTMPYVRGESLRARLLKGGELPLSETIRILREVASALSYAHEAGVVHRDIKPENILISGGSAVVTDFGVAKALTLSSGAQVGTLTSLGVALGTPAYMSPEQATADPAIDSRADIYSFGIVAYEMLTGTTPFSGRSPQATLAAHVTENPEPITRRRNTVPPMLSALVMRCLEKHAADRPQTATSVMHELDALNTPSGGTNPTTVTVAASPRRILIRWITIGLSVAAVIVLAVIGTKRIQRETDKPPVVAPAIAVLPFENIGGKDGQDFADGMTEEITNRLSTLRGLRVIGRQSARSYAKSDKTPQQIATELGVKYVLTGTVRWDKAPDGKDLVRVSPALVRADDATQLWAEAYQTPMSGMFDVQAKVATEVASALNITLLAPEKTALAARPTDNPDAYSLYLRGRDLLDFTLQSGQVREAIALLQKATTADPKFTLAWATLAIAHTELYWFRGDPTTARLAMAKGAIEKAASLDGRSPDVHLARAVYLYHGKRDYEGALEELAIAERARPSDYNIKVYKGAIERRQGRWDDAVTSQKEAFEIEPRNGSTALDVGTTLFALGRFAEAEQFIDRGMVLSPEQANGPSRKTSIALSVRGNVPEAIQHLRDAVTTVKPHSALTDLLLNHAWPGVEDPSLRRLLIDAQYSPDLPPNEFYAKKAMLFVYLNDQARAKAYADTAVTAAEATIRNTPETSVAYGNLATSLAILGKRTEALQAFARADEVLPKSKDAFAVVDRDNMRPVLYMLLGDQQAALASIEQRLNVPEGLTRNYVRLDPIFAPLRANARFQRLISGS
ncbi:MAG TPA: protein kinase [Gemmatimonadaceae bacterium]|nr:protein kinase [Gemmatimonadaceae bacterium]